MNNESVDKIKEIRCLIDKAQDIYNALPDEDQNEIFKEHHENYSMGYCLRWGLTAADDIIRLCQEAKQ